MVAKTKESGNCFRQTMLPNFVLLVALIPLALLISSWSTTTFRKTSFGGYYARARRWVDASRRSAIIDLGEPFTFTVPRKGNEGNTYIITSAIAVPEEDQVIFLSPLREHGRAEQVAANRIVPLSPNHECVFERPGQPDEKTGLEMYRSGERNFSSVVVWRCPIPNAGGINTYPSVRVSVPSKNIVSGRGVFGLKQPEIPSTDIISCTKLEIEEEGNAMHLKTLEYLRHYRALGVGHFVFFVSYGDATADVLSRFKDVTTIRMPPNFNEAVLGEPVPKQRVFEQVQKVVGTDCVWRTRYKSRWNMIMVDVDEYVVGTPDLRETLAKEGDGYSAVRLKHRLVETPYGEPLVHEGIRATKDFVSTMGKAIVRPRDVDVMWVHGASAFAPKAGKKEKILSSVSLLHFRALHLSVLKLQNADDFEEVDLSALPSSLTKRTPIVRASSGGVVRK